MVRDDENKLSEEELRGLHRENDENPSNAFTHLRLALHYRLQNSDYRSNFHARETIKCLQEGLESELQTGIRNPEFGLEHFVESQEVQINGLFDEKEGEEADNIFQSISNVNLLREIDYDGNVGWNDIRSVLADFEGMENIAIASKIILDVASNPEQKDYISSGSINFLKKCISTAPGLNPDDVGYALEFFSDKGGAFGKKRDKATVENLVTFFTSVKRYDDERAMVARYCAGDIVRHVVDVFKPYKFIYVLGEDKVGDLVSRLDSVDKSDNKKRKAIYMQMASRILEQNALKCFLGFIEYASFMKTLLEGEEKDKASFFENLCPTYITNNQLKAVKNFINGFPEVHRIPVHEYKNPTTARNKNFEARIQLGNSGELRTFVKFYTSAEGNSNAQREKFFLEGAGKDILEKEYGVTVPPALASTTVKLRDGSECDVLMLFFINASTLDEIVNNPSSPEYSMKGDLIKNAAVELAKVHNATSDLEAAAQKEEVTLFEVGSEYFTEDLKIQLSVPHSNIKQNIANKLLQTPKKLCEYLRQESEEDGVYYKDSNTRNIFGPPQRRRKSSASSTQVTLLDYECGVKILGEVDLMKIMRNGLGFDDWDPRKNYKANEQEKRENVESYIKTKRYHSREDEQEVIQTYNETRVDSKSQAKSYTPEAQKRFDMAALYTHIWYVSWFSHKMNESDISNQTREVVGNRVNFHLLEAKLALDHVMYDGNVSYATEFERPQLIESLGLKELRKSLDLIPINN
ncbi:MAG: hypothetical protein U9O94_01975 [Nanoarchaeota archaeon]|nr:hypothetical protein [Nanoarchaeota archaeon]